MLRNIISKLFNRETYKSLVKMPSNSSENARLFIGWAVLVMHG